MKFHRKSKKIGLSDHSRKKLSHRDLAVKISEGKPSKKKIRLSFMKNLTWNKKKELIPVIQKKNTLITSSLSPCIEDLENEFIFMLKKINQKSEIQDTKHGEYSSLAGLYNLNNSFKDTITECEQYQTKSHAKRRLLITRSTDDFARTARKRYPCSSLSSQFVHQSLLKNAARRSSHSDISLTSLSIYRLKAKVFSESINNQMGLPSDLSIKPESCLKNPNFSNNCQLSLHWNENSVKSTSKYYPLHDAAIIDIEHQSILSLNKSLEKSHSSPLPMNTNHSSINSNPIQSAHVIDQYPYVYKNTISSYSCASEIGDDQSTESISSDEESVRHSLLQYNKKSLRHRWSLLDIWETTLTKLPPILNRIWRKQLRRTGSKEFLLEYDQILPANNNNNNHYHRANFSQEQRYVERERPIHSHIGVALLALLIFPPVGILAFILSLWSLCGQQDRHLSRKFGNAVYWISIFAICLSFLVLFTLFTYFTYQYLTTHRIRHPITKDIDYI